MVAFTFSTRVRDCVGSGGAANPKRKDTLSWCVDMFQIHVIRVYDLKHLYIYIDSILQKTKQTEICSHPQYFFQSSIGFYTNIFPLFLLNQQRFQFFLFSGHHPTVMLSNVGGQPPKYSDESWGYPRFNKPPYTITYDIDCIHIYIYIYIFTMLQIKIYVIYITI